MEKSCARCQQNFQISADDLDFYERVAPVIAGVKYSIPEPTHCPNCRQQRRIAICNERHLYPDKCDLCNKPTLTEYSPSNRPTIYCRECFHSDKWDPRDYGKEFDFSRPFFEQFHELTRNVPRQSLDQEGLVENSDYIHHAGDCKNCYLIMHADGCEDCSYGYGFKFNTSCMDGFYTLRSELCFDCIDVHKCYGLIACQDSKNCHSSAFLRDCIGCKNCFMCTGLRQKEYCFENQQLTKEEYEAKMAQIDLGSYSAYQMYKAQFEEFQKNHKHKAFQGHNTQNCFGDHLTNCKDLLYSFDCEDVESGKYCYQVVTGGKNLYDINQYGYHLEHSYECCICGQSSSRIYFSTSIHLNCSDLLYCWYIERSSNLFGCSCIMSGKYCILNKQYSKEEYEELVPRIIEHMKKTGEWGEFFPMGMGFHAYNKTTAQMYYPLTKEQAVSQGLRWDDYEVPMPAGFEHVNASDLPDNIRDVDESILKKAIICEVTGRPYKITGLELRLLKKFGVPLPRRSPDQRHMDRFSRRNSRHFWPRECGKCSRAMYSTFHTKRPETVYCDECYMTETY